MEGVSAAQQGPKVTFRLYCFSKENALGLLPPEGKMVIQYLQFPIDFEDCTCIPTGPVGFFSKAGVIESLERQWYRPREKLERKDIPDLNGSPLVKACICHQRRPDPNSYPLSELTVDGKEVHLVAFIGKQLLFRRLGQQVMLDLSSVPATQPFTLAVEWSPTHIEARVTWVEGEEMEKYYPGVGMIPELGIYENPSVGNIVRIHDRKEFDALLIPAPIARAIWRAGEKAIDDSNRPLDVGAPRKSYADQQDFLQTVLEVLLAVQRVVLRVKPHAFWDDSGKSEKTPKRETHTGAALRMLFEAICAYKNIRVFQEDPTRSGNVDFEFTGISLDLNHLNVVLEIKNAHSNDVEHGLTVQLPTYLQEREVPSGIYGVLWYKGTHFDKPNDATLSDCIGRLDQKKPVGVVAVVGFDLAFTVQASKK